MIDFACADFTFPILTHDKALMLIAMMDFKKVDIGIFKDRSHIQPADQFDLPEKRGAALKAKAEGFGLEVDDIFLQSSLDFKEFAINHPDSTIRAGQREMFCRAIDYTKAAGAAHFTGLPGVDFETDSRNLCVEELAWRVEIAEKNGVIYSVEPHLGSIMEKPAIAVEILREVEGLTIALDHSHFTSQGIDVKRLHMLTQYTSILHARGAKQGEMQTSLKRNTTDFAKVVEHINEVNFNGTICMEYCYIDWEGMNRTDNISETILLREHFLSLMNFS